MKINRYLIMVLVVMVIVCNKQSTGPIESEDPVLTIEKSYKCGLAFNLMETSDFDALKARVSWWYNWHYETSVPESYYTEYEMEYIPMLWGGNPSECSINQIKEFILVQPEIEYLLVMNEPNLLDQVIGIT